MFGFDYRCLWEQPVGHWRCWVCVDCRIVSYPYLRWCPGCGRMTYLDRDWSDKLRAKYPTARSGGEWRPYEYDPGYSLAQQPWREAGGAAEPVRESREQQEHDAHAVAAFGP